VIHFRGRDWEEVRARGGKVIALVDEGDRQLAKLAHAVIEMPPAPALLEAASDLYARPLRTFLRVTLPLSLPGVIAGTILVFIPTMGMFVVPDLMGGARTALVGNLVQRQFLAARDWPFGAAASMVLMILTLAATLLYTRVSGFGEELVV